MGAFGFSEEVPAAIDDAAIVDLAANRKTGGAP